jgi:hypothetical protein
MDEDDQYLIVLGKVVRRQRALLRAALKDRREWRQAVRDWASVPYHVPETSEESWYRSVMLWAQDRLEELELGTRIQQGQAALNARWALLCDLPFGRFTDEELREVMCFARDELERHNGTRITIIEQPYPEEEKQK